MTLSTPMSCKELVELVTDYEEDVLLEADRQRFEQHVSDCPWCQRYLEQMRLTIRTLGRIDESGISDDAKQTLLVAFLDWHRSHPG
jgi:hypothetical protein